jgi:hypothetical protein
LIGRVRVARCAVQGPGGSAARVPRTPFFRERRDVHATALFFALVREVHCVVQGLGGFAARFTRGQ